MRETSGIQKTRRYPTSPNHNQSVYHRDNAGAKINSTINRMPSHKRIRTKPSYLRSIGYLRSPLMGPLSCSRVPSGPTCMLSRHGRGASGSLWWRFCGRESHLSDSDEIARRRRSQTQVGQGRIATGSFRLHPAIPSQGNPGGLKGEQIPRAARIFAWRTWDALTSARPYRAAWTKEKALAHIREQSGKHFRPRGGRGVPPVGYLRVWGGGRKQSVAPIARMSGQILFTSSSRRTAVMQVMEESDPLPPFDPPPERWYTRTGGS